MQDESFGFGKIQQLLSKRLYLSTRRAVLIFTAFVTQIPEYRTLAGFD
jgi:hypothetical protein